MKMSAFLITQEYVDAYLYIIYGQSSDESGTWKLGFWVPDIHQAVSIILVPCPDSVARCGFAKNFSKMPKSPVI